MTEDSKRMEVITSLCNQGKLDEARTKLESYLKDYPKSSEGWRLAAQIDLNHFEDIDKAFDELIEALRLEPKNVWALVLMGNLLLEKKNDFESANTYFNKVLEFHPDNAVALTNVGVALSKQQKYSDALIFFNRAVKSDPTYANAYLGIGFSYYYTGDYQKAFDEVLEGLHKSVSRPEDPNVYSQMVACMKNAAEQIAKTANFKQLVNEVVDKLQRNDHLPIHFKRDDTLQVAARLEYGPTHGRLEHIVVYNPSKPIYDYLSIHELTHLKMMQHDTVAKTGYVFAAKQDGWEKFKNDYSQDVKERLKSIPEADPESFMKQIFDGQGTQVLSCPLDLFVDTIIYSDYPQLRPLQFLWLYSEELEFIGNINSTDLDIFPADLLRNNKVMNIVSSLVFRRLYCVNILNQFKATASDFQTAEKLYQDFLDTADNLRPGDEYRLVKTFIETLGVEDYYELVPESKVNKVYEEKKAQAEEQHRDDYADEKNARYALEHQDGSDPRETLMMAMYMEVAMDHCDKIGDRGTQLLAMECAHVGLTGINPSKNYVLHYVSEKPLDGYQVIAFYYVSFARKFPQYLKEIGLPYTKAYDLALKRYQSKHKK